MGNKRVITIVALTRPFSALSPFVRDRESHSIEDFELTGISYFRITLGYYFSSVIISFMMQIVALIVCLTGFHFLSGVTETPTACINICGLIIGASLLWSLVALFIMSFIHNMELLGIVNGIVGALSGFLAVTYIPIGSLPLFAQKVFELTPAPYTSALMRQVLMSDQIASTFAGMPNSVIDEYNAKMGVNLNIDIYGLNLPQNVLYFVICIGFAIIFLFLIALYSRYSKIHR